MKVLAASGDGEKYFGEAGKKSGWFPQVYAKREAPGTVVQSFTSEANGSPGVSGPKLVRKTPHTLESLSRLAEGLPSTALSVRRRNPLLSFSFFLSLSLFNNLT